jgi:hypothetical protein
MLFGEVCLIFPLVFPSVVGLVIQRMQVGHACPVSLPKGSCAQSANLRKVLYGLAGCPTPVGRPYCPTKWVCCCEGALLLSSVRETRDCSSGILSNAGRSAILADQFAQIALKP